MEIQKSSYEEIAIAKDLINKWVSIDVTYMHEL